MPVVASHCVKRAWRATPAAADRGAAAGGIDRDGGGGGRGGGAPARRAVPGREARRLFSGGTRGRCVRCQAPARRRVAPAPRPLAPHDRAATVRTSPTHSQNRSDGRGGTSQRPEPLSVAEMPAPMRMRPWGGARVGATARSLRLGEVLRCRGAEAMQGVGRVRGGRPHNSKDRTKA